MIDVVAVLAIISVAVIAVGYLGQPGERHTVSLTFPRTLTTAQAVAAVRALSGLLPPWWRRIFGAPALALELRADAAGITHRLTMPAARAEQVTGALRAAIPGLRVGDVDRTEPARYSLARELRTSGTGSLRTDTAAETNAGILAGLVPLDRDERAVIQYVITPTAPLPGARLMETIRGDGGPASEPASIEPTFAVALRVGVSAPTPARSRALMARLLGAFHPAGTHEARLRRRFLPSALVVGGLRRTDPGHTTLTADEVAAVWGVPLDAPDVPGLTLAQSRELAPVASVLSRGVVLGDSTVAGNFRPVAVDPSELRRGMLVTAPTGAGKSTILTSLAVQLMNARSRPSLIAIDAKGDYAADLVDRIPPHRRDVIVFDPTDSKPVGFNVIGGSGDSDLIVDHVVSELRARYGAAGLGPRSEDILRSCLATLTAQPAPYTLCEVEPLLTNSAFLQKALANLDNPVLQAFWSWYMSLSDAARAEAIAPLANKLRTYTLRRRVRAVIGQAEGGLDLAAALDGGKVVVISLATGTVGEDAAALLGAAMISRLWATTQARAGVPPAKRRPAVVICDEFQTFASAAGSGSVFGDAVSRSRGYAVSWVLAHQHLAQLDPATRQAVLANCRTRLVMQTTAADATAFAKEFRPFLTADDLQGLGAFEGYAAVSAGATVAPPASIRTRPAPDPLGSAEAVRAASRARYGMTPAAVDAAIRKRVERTRRTAPVGETRRPS